MLKGRKQRKMKKTHKQMLMNQCAIMEALLYLMMPEAPKKKEYIRSVAAGELHTRAVETERMIRQEKRRKGE